MKNQSSHELYKNAPLIEAIFEIRFAGEPAIECHRELFYEEVRDKYPKVFVPTITKIGDAPSLTPYKFMDVGNNTGFLVAINSLAFSTKKYKGFAAFKSEILHFFSIFKKLYNINQILRTGLRFINFIPFLRADKNIFPLNTYLNVDIKFPSKIPNRFKDFQARFITQIDEGVITTNIQPLTSLDKKQEVIILDFDYGKTGDLNYNNIEAYLEESHRNTKMFFESLITDEYRSIMKGEVI